MPPPVPLFQEMFQYMLRLTRPAKRRRTAVRRMALRVTGLVAAQNCSVNRIAAALLALGLTRARDVASLERRLRRIRSDGRLSAATCYDPFVQEAVDWDSLRRTTQPVVLIVDESTQGERSHVFRISLAYRGGGLPVRWALWKQNVPLPAGDYWRQVDEVLARAAAVIPADLPVLVVADRANDIPPFVDRIAKLGWHWIVRVKAGSDLRFCDRFGHAVDLGGLLRWHLRGPNPRWKIRGRVFKKAGGREARVVGVWAAPYQEPVVVLPDLPPRWEVIAIYRRRFWIEPSFRNDQSHGWQWDHNQVPSLQRQETLLVAFAWATLLTLCLGVAVARERLIAVTRQPRPKRPHDHGVRRPQHARTSIFTLGLQQIRRLLYQAIPTAISWILPDLGAPSWTDTWFAGQFQSFLFETVRP